MSTQDGDRLIGQPADAQLRAQISTHLSRYGQALSDFDAEAAAALWGEPGMIVSDAFAGALDSRSEMAAGLQQGYPRLRQLGLARVDHELLAARAITASLVLVDVRWLFYDADDRLLTDGLYVYLLRRERGEFRTYLAVPIDEAEKIRELTRRQEAAGALETGRPGAD